MAKSMEAYLKQRKLQSDTALENGLPDDPVNKALDREFDAQFNIATHLEDITLVSLQKLRPYSKHPFKAYNEEKLTALAESIARDGLQQPVIVRRIDGIPGWEILAGHNRVEAMRRLCKTDIPAIVRELDDKQAALVVVTTNLEQREKLLPSEKAFAYKLQMEALQNGENLIIKNGCLSSDCNGLQAGYQIDTQRKGQVLSDEKDESYAQIFRYIRLTHLLSELLDLLDSEKIPIMAGYEISFLPPETQQEVHRYFFQTGTKDKLTLKNAQALRAAVQAGKPVTNDTIPDILHRPKKTPGPGIVQFSQKELKRRYNLPKDFDLTAFVYAKLEESFAKGK